MKENKKISKTLIISIFYLLGKIFKRKGVPILLYHRVIESPVESPISAISINSFEQQMINLQKKGYKTLNTEQFVQYINNGLKHIPKKSFMITFDDGFEDNYKAIKLAKNYGFNCIVFVSTNFIGNSYQHVPFIGKNRKDQVVLKGDISFLSYKQLQELHELGTEILPHTHNHASLPNIEKSLLRNEISESTNIISGIINKKPKLFSYPYGDYDDGTITELKKNNYIGAFAVIDGVNVKGEDLFKIKRHNVSDVSNLYFELLLMQSYAWYKKTGIILRKIGLKI